MEIYCIIILYLVFITLLLKWQTIYYLMVITDNSKQHTFLHVETIL